MPYSKLHAAAREYAYCSKCETDTERYVNGRCAPCARLRSRLKYRTLIGRAQHDAAYKRHKAKYKGTGKESIRHRRQRYGLSHEEYSSMLLAQGGYCAIDNCSVHEESNKPLFVDHCHRTNKIRGLLCCKHNTQLAVFDSSEFEALQFYWRTA